MSNEIKPGDLVMVVRPRSCCGNAKSIGLVAKVVEMKIPTLPVACFDCGSIRYDIENFRHISNGTSCEVSRLKKIDPPDLADEVEHERELETV